jgi:Zn-dependent protease
MDLARASRQEETVVVTTPRSYEYTVSLGAQRKVSGRVYFSPKEIKHLALATLIVIGVGLSLGFYGGMFSPDFLIVAIAFTAILTASFFAHEIAHKVVAQRSGLWAEFRLTVWGAVLTLVFMILPTPFKLISPGAVMISGPARLGDIGRISIAGPATNLVFSSMFLALGISLPGIYSWIFVLGALINGYIAVFNLIPFGIFDGFKIFSWNKMVWVLAFALGLALTIGSYILF